jgi:hypothetical protein
LRGFRGGRRPEQASAAGTIGGSATDVSGFAQPGAPRVWRGPLDIGVSIRDGI